MAPGRPTVEEPLLTVPRPPRFWGSPFGWTFSVVATVALVGAAVLVAGGLRAPAPALITVKGIMASKQDFFEDATVRRLLAEHGIRVEVTTRGSSEVAQEVVDQDRDQHDFTFPSGQPAADRIKDDRTRERKYARATRLFSSPIVLASYRQYADALVADGAAVRQGPEGSLYYTLETARFVRLGEAEKTWDAIGIGAHKDGDGRAVTNGNRVLAHTPGVCRSNSGAAYLALVAFVKNGGRPPRDEAEADRLAREIQPLITGTGMPESELFMSYVTPEGKSLGPVVVVYEHQYLAYQIDQKKRTGTVDADRVLLYPRQEFQTDPEFIALRPGGADRLAELLATDRLLRKRMMELGYRVFDRTDDVGTEQLFQYLRDRGIAHPRREDVTTAVLPQLDLLEKLIGTAGRCRR